MGGPTSGRWHDHRRAALVEDTPALSLAQLRRQGLFERPDEPLRIEWTRSGEPVAQARVRLLGNGPERRLNVVAERPGQAKALRTELGLVSQPCHFGGHRWFFRCPEAGCVRRALKLYLSPGGDRVACRQCLGLTHRSAQQHDKRIDQARRDPVGFEQARANLRGLKPQLVTAQLVERAVMAMVAPRRGRGWGQNSMTSWRRAAQELLTELSDKDR